MLKVAYYRSPVLWNKKREEHYSSHFVTTLALRRSVIDKIMFSIFYCTVCLFIYFYTGVISLLILLIACLLMLRLLLSHILKFRRKLVPWHLSYKLQYCLAFMFIIFTYLDVWPANSNLLKWKRKKSPGCVWYIQILHVVSNYRASSLRYGCCKPVDIRRMTIKCEYI